MLMREPSTVDIAIRAYPEIDGETRKPRVRVPWNRPSTMLIFDTETRTDATQSLMFGCFRFIVDGQCVREALFHARDLSEEEFAALKNYAATRPANVAPHGRRALDLLSLDEFLDEFFRAAYKGRCVVVGFNLPFDLSRLAFDVAPSRGEFAGGFSLGLWSYVDGKGRRKRNAFRPRIGIRHIDSKRSLIGFTARKSPDSDDLDTDKKTGKARTFRGHFLDLRTLAFALDRSHSLKSACDAFGVEQGKLEVSEHGKITEEYIAYCRRDVEATVELAEKLLEEFDRHPIQLRATSAFSPASIGKAYLREMGTSPILDRQKNLQPYIGYAQSAFFGGRTSAHIRKFPVPVVYTDFLSMYPTVNSLMDLWTFVTAKEVRVRTGCNDEIKSFLEQITPDRLFEQSTWKQLTAFVRIVPQGNILPSRAKYNPATNDWQVGINYVYAGNSDDALWYSLPDVVASVLLTGRVPEIVDSFILEPHGTLPTLQPTKLRGKIDIDPRGQDFFRVVIEERKRLSRRNDITGTEKERLSTALKVLANSASYGIYAEMNRQDSSDRVQVSCHGVDAEPFLCNVQNPEISGEFCFPPFASLITGAARLMLALLEKCVTDAGGTYAMEDTDSMAIVATETGGLVDCPGGNRRQKNGTKAVHALSWAQVEGIVERFKSLSPYDKSAIPGSILKIEDDNFDPKTGKQRQIWCYAISAKRYALFLRDKEGTPDLLRNGKNNNENRWSEHGLGHLLNPTDPECEDREWIAHVWQSILNRAAGIEIDPPQFRATPAVGRINVSNPAILRALDGLNSGKEYSKQIKPFNFLLSCHVNALGHPFGIDPTRFHLIAPYEGNPAKWTKLKWIDQYSGNIFAISTSEYSSRMTANVKTFGDVISEYEFHAEPKCADWKGNICGKQARGLLQRRHVRIDRIRYIGKESNELEEIDAGLIHSEADAYIEYVDPRRDEWETKIRPALKGISLSKLCKETGFSRRTVINWRTGKSRPHPNNQQILIDHLRRLGN
jgi:hypothetical protein